MLQCDKLSKQFEGVRALVNFTAVFPEAELVAIIGPNGSGKSTLFNIISGFVRANTGRCYIDDREITHLAPYRIAGYGVTRTFQEPRLVRNVSVIDNVLLAIPQQYGETVIGALLQRRWRNSQTRHCALAHRLLERVGLGSYAHLWAGTLSYGQQKLLTFACSLATKAEVLLFDEPLAGLDPELSAQIETLLVTQRSKNKTVLIIEHDLEFVRRVADTVFVLVGGELIAAGRPNDILERDDVLRAYVG